jgi:hypothetical protein
MIDFEHIASVSRSRAIQARQLAPERSAGDSCGDGTTIGFRFGG